MDDFIIRALVAGIGISMITGFLGCFVVWKKMAYFGDSLAHSSLLGITLGIAFGLNSNIGVILTASLFALLLTYLQSKKILSTDTLLGILSHGSLALGMVVISFMDGHAINVHSFLFGDILTVTVKEITWIVCSLIFIYAVLIFNWQKLIMVTICENLAKSININIFKSQLILTGLLTLTVAISIQIIGVLLITSMLIIPAATSRQITNSPEKMAVFSVLIGIISVIFGMLFSYNFDSPSGPSIILIAAGLFFVVILGKFSLRKN